MNITRGRNEERVGRVEDRWKESRIPFLFIKKLPETVITPQEVAERGGGAAEGKDVEGREDVFLFTYLPY